MPHVIDPTAEDCPYAVTDYQVTPEIEAQLAAIKQNPERLRDYKPTQLELEDALCRHEMNVEAGKQYRFEKQDELIDEKARLVNIISTRELMRRLHRIEGIRGYLIDAGRPGQLGLFVHMRGNECRVYDDLLPKGVKPICFVQAPYMPEWSVLRIDDHGLPVDEKYRGWQTVRLRLIKHGAISEQEADEAFGRVPENILSRRLREELWIHRNRL